MCVLLLDHAQFFCHFDEGGDALVEVFTLVSGTELHANARFALGHYRIVETGHIDALFLHGGGKVLAQLGIIEHHGANGTLGGLDVEAGGNHLVAEVVHIVHELAVQGVAVFEHLEHFEAGTHTAMLDSLGYRQLTSKAIISHTIGGFGAALVAHWTFMLYQLIAG